jgi:hypothetical protein
LIAIETIRTLNPNLPKQVVGYSIISTGAHWSNITKAINMLNIIANSEYSIEKMSKSQIIGSMSKSFRILLIYMIQMLLII